MQTVKPAPTQVFAKPTEAEEKTASGFILTGSQVEKPKTASIINIGDKVKWLRPEDLIVYKPYTTTDIKLNGDEYFLIDAEDVLGVVLEVEK